jgi:hypothetical protein
MPCHKCKSERLIQVSAKCSDLCYCRIGETEHDGYVPKDVVFGEGQFGDYVAFDLCLDCGQMQGKWPNPPMALETGEEE